MRRAPDQPTKNAASMASELQHNVPEFAGYITELATSAHPHDKNARQPAFEQPPMTTILLLTFSNIFMTIAWYGHLKYGHDWPLWKAIVVSWFIALLEYCLAVPANRIGYLQFSGFQLKIIQEVVTLLVFIAFAVLFLKEKLAWNYIVAFLFLAVAAFFAFAFNTTGTAA
jgi:uncharacterized protein